jgi:hypothetical protein
MIDEGTRVDFGEGSAIREDVENKSRPDLISPLATLKLGEWAGAGGKKYGDWNFMKGMPYSRYVQSMHRHLLKWQAGDREECHLSAIAWNALALLHHEEMGEDEKWNDLPKLKRTK